MLTDFSIHATIATADLERARQWYADKLGWTPLRELEGALVYGVGETIFSVYASEFAGTAKNTVAAWEVPDVRAEVSRLRERGVVFDDLDLGDMKTVDGIATGEYGDVSAWFRDSDGNYFALGEMNEEVDRRFAEALGLSKPLPPSQLGVRPILAASDLDRARAWYSERLGLTPYIEIPGEILLYLEGPMRFSIYATPNAGTAKNTVAMWWVDDVAAEMATLKARGVTFESYDTDDLKTVDGILADADGEMAWFKDSEGNILGIGHFAELAALNLRPARATASA